MASEPHVSTDRDAKAVDQWSGWFLDCLGLGLAVTATAVLLDERAVASAAALYVISAASLAAGLSWRWLEPRLSPALSGSVAQIANDFRWWLVLLAALVLLNWVPIGASMTSATAPAAVKQLLSKPSLEWDGAGPVRFTARYQRSGANLRIYVDWGAAYGGGGNSDLLGGSGVFLPSPRIQIGAIDRFVAGQELDVVLAVISAGKDYDDIELKWGAENYESPKVNVSWGSYMGKIVATEPNSREEAYPFLLVARSRANAEGKATALPPLLIGPSILVWFAK